MRITRKDIETLAKSLAQELGYEWGHYRKTADGYVTIPRGWDLNHNSHYGGYEIREIDRYGNGCTGVWSVTGHACRRPAREMHAWLLGALEALRIFKAKQSK